MKASRWRDRHGASQSSKPYRVMHLTTVDMSLMLLLGAQLAGALADGAEVHTVSADGPWTDRVRAMGVQHHPLAHSTRGWSLRSDLAAARELWRIVRRVRPTILHTHNPKPGVYGRIVGRLAGVPIVVNTVHGLYATEEDRRLKRMVVYGLERLASTFSNAELVQNEEDVATMRRFHLARRSKIRLLGNGVDLRRFASDAAARERLRNEWGVGPDEMVVGSVGRLVAEKGFPELFDAVRSVRAAMPERVRLVVAGPDDPDKSDALPREVIERTAADGTVLLGHRDDIPAVLNGFDMFVLASHREGFPRAAMEASATGLPVVATDIRGCRQVVAAGVTGELVEPRRSQALADAIERLAGDPARRASMGAAAVAKAAAEFDEVRVVERVLGTYRHVARRKRITLTS